jgi:DNA polymerase-3 subunit beta
MKFSCERDAIISEISIAQEIISSKNVLSILSNVLLTAEEGKLLIRATDMKVGFETVIPVEVGDPGSTTVFCDKLLGILRALPSGEVEFSLAENMMLTIKPIFKKIDFKLKSISSERFPELQAIQEEHFFDFSQKDFIEMVSSTIFAISDDETRYFMNGVYLEKADDHLVMVASDGRRLSYISKDAAAGVPEIKGMIIPPKILNMLRKLLPGEGNLSLCITDKNIFARFGSNRLSSSLIEGQFPNYQRVIPQHQEQRVIVEKELLESALRRVSLLVEQKSRRVFMKIEEDNLIVSSEESDIGMAREEIPCRYQGPEAEIALNCLYLMEPLREMKEESISIDFTDTNKAITIKSVPEKDYLHIIMPMQVK